MTEQDFKDAYNQFDTAVGALIGIRWDTIRLCTGVKHRPGCECAGTKKTWADPLYTAIRHELEGLSGDQGKGKSESRPPVWVDGLDWLRKVDAKTRAWTPNSDGGTARRLDELSRHSFSPVDSDWLRKATNDIQSWVNDGTALLQGEEDRRFDVVAACTECGTRTVIRKDSGGDLVRKTALQVGLNGCVCLACGTRWDRDHLSLLANALGCEQKELA